MLLDRLGREGVDDGDADGTGLVGRRRQAGQGPPGQVDRIGTPEGHDRLREALGAVDSVERPPPLPRNLVLASRLTWAGVGAAILSAMGDVLLALAFRSALERPDPADPDGGNDWEFIAGSTVAWLVAAVLIGLLAIAALHAVRRSRNESTRVLLAVLAGMAIASAVSPIGSPILALADTEGVVGMLVLRGWMAGKAAVAAPAIGTLVLLMSPPVRAYTRTPAPAAVGTGVHA